MPVKTNNSLFKKSALLKLGALALLASSTGPSTAINLKKMFGCCADPPKTEGTTEEEVSPADQAGVDGPNGTSNTDAIVEPQPVLNVESQDPPVTVKDPAEPEVTQVQEPEPVPATQDSPKEGSEEVVVLEKKQAEEPVQPAPGPVTTEVEGATGTAGATSSTDPAPATTGEGEKKVEIAEKAETEKKEEKKEEVKKNGGGSCCTIA